MASIISRTHCSPQESRFFVFLFFFFRKISLYHKSKLKFSILLCLVCFLMYVMGDDFVELVSR